MIIKAGDEGQEVLHLTSVEALTMIENLAAQLKQQESQITVNLFHYDQVAPAIDESIELDEADTEPKKSDIWIRNFGNDTRCATRKILRKTLATKYKGLSVSVRFEAKNGARRVIYVDVDIYGVIRDRAANNEIVDFDTLFDTQL